MVGSGRDVLDVGCGEGFLATELKRQGNRVTGIDALSEAEQTEALEQYFSADLDAGIAEVVEKLRGKRFDRVLLMDVLEHLKRPEVLLRQCKDVLKPEGAVVVSLPNIANLTVRLMLLVGRFNYTVRGILDKTHVRFFTRRTARRFLEENGYRIVEEKITVMPLELVLGLDHANLMMRALNISLGLFTRLFPGLLGYQIMFLGKIAKTPNTNRV